MNKPFLGGLATGALACALSIAAYQKFTRAPPLEEKTHIEEKAHEEITDGYRAQWITRKQDTNMTITRLTLARPDYQLFYGSLRLSVKETGYAKTLLGSNGIYTTPSDLSIPLEGHRTIDINCTTTAGLEKTINRFHFDPTR